MKDVHNKLFFSRRRRPHSSSNVPDVASISSNSDDTGLTGCVNRWAGGKEVKRQGGEVKREERGKHDQDEEIEGREQREEEREKRAETREKRS